MEDKNSRRPVTRRTLPETKEYTILKVIFSIAIMICLGFAVAMTVVVFTIDPDNTPYFIKHFGLGISLIAVGVVAVLMTILNKYNVNSSDQGDRLMRVVGALLIIFGIGTIIFFFIF